MRAREVRIQFWNIIWDREEKRKVKVYSCLRISNKYRSIGELGGVRSGNRIDDSSCHQWFVVNVSSQGKRLLAGIDSWTVPIDYYVTFEATVKPKWSKWLTIYTHTHTYPFSNDICSAILFFSSRYYFLFTRIKWIYCIFFCLKIVIKIGKEKAYWRWVHQQASEAGRGASSLGYPDRDLLIFSWCDHWSHVRPDLDSTAIAQYGTLDTRQDLSPSAPAPCLVPFHCSDRSFSTAGHLSICLPTWGVYYLTSPTAISHTHTHIYI